MPTHSKHKPKLPKPPKPLSLAFTNIRGLHGNFHSVESYLMQLSPDIFALSESNLNPTIRCEDFSVSGYLPFIRKDYEINMHGLAVYVRDSLPVSRQINLEDPNQPFMCFRLSLLHSTSYVFFLYRSPSSQNCAVLNAVSNSIDEALNVKPTANIFVCGDFNVHHKDWIPNSHITDEAGVNTLNFSIAQDLTQMVNFFTRFPDRRDQLPATLDLFLSSYPSICNISSSSSLGSSDHIVISIDVSLNSVCVKDPPIHRNLFSYENCDWDAFRDFLRDVPWENIFELDVDNCAYEISSWIQAGIDAFVQSRKFQVKPHSPWYLLGILLPVLQLYLTAITIFISITVILLKITNVSLPLLGIIANEFFPTLSWNMLRGNIIV